MKKYTLLLFITLSLYAMEDVPDISDFYQQYKAYYEKLDEELLELASSPPQNTSYDVIEHLPLAVKTPQKIIDTDTTPIKTSTNIYPYNKISSPLPQNNIDPGTQYEYSCAICNIRISHKSRRKVYSLAAGHLKDFHPEQNPYYFYLKTPSLKFHWIISCPICHANDEHISTWDSIAKIQSTFANNHKHPQIKKFNFSYTIIGYKNYTSTTKPPYQSKKRKHMGTS